jgi:ABC-2 type transport system permease protein
MKALLHFEYSRFYSKIWFYVLLLLILGFGFVVGTGLSLSLSQNIYKNSPYTITLMSGFLSLFVIFFSTMLITQIAFKETDSRFHLIFYALPIPEKIFLLSRFWVIFSLSFLGFFLLILGFSIGQQFATNRSQYTHFQWLWYAQPLLVLGLVNTLFCSAVLSAVAWLSRNKMMVYVSGLLLYVLYMVALIFSGSPLMAKGMPQSELNTLLSAILDPFGISGFFYETSHWTVEQRNSEMIFPEGVFLYNRLGFTFLSLILGWVVLKKFSFEKQQNSLKSKIVDKQEIKTKRYHPYGILSEYKLFRYFLLRFRLDETSIQTKESQRDGSLIEKKYTTRQAKSQRDDTFFGRIINSIPFRHLIALFSITKIDLKYVFKSIPFVLICLGFLFCVGMEMFGDIEKGIRLPQKFARSGLMASTIIDEFNIFCLFGIVFYANDLFWRSRASNFHLIESSTPTQKNLIIASKWLSLGLLILFFSCLMILLGIAFQLLYHFPHIDWLAYTGVFVFVSFRVFVAAGFMLFIEQFLPNKILALLVSSIFIGVFATAFGNRFLDYPALEFLMPFAGKYSDMNGYGSYLGYFILRYTFGLSLVIFLLAKPYRFLKPIRFVLVIIPLFLGFQLSKNYQKEDKESEILKAVNYEKQYRKFQNLAKPTVSNLKTKIDLFPENQTYQIEGEYILQNKTSQKIDSVLINFVDDFEIQNSDFEGNKIENQYAVIHLKKPILPGILSMGISH